ncbi:MAG: AlbA family DNA-binding domain-containing protein [Metamycoplasmataceae bacterium]
MENINEFESIDKEFKLTFDDNSSIKNKIYNTIKAFHNTYGGILYIGINDSGDIIGLPKKDLDNIILNITSKFQNKIINQIEVKMSNDKYYLAVYVEQGNELIFEENSSLFIRSNSSTIKIFKEEIEKFILFKKVFSEKVKEDFKNIFDINLNIDWKYRIEEKYELSSKYEKFKKNILQFWNKLNITFLIDTSFFLQIIERPKLENELLLFEFGVFVGEYNHDFGAPNFLYISSFLVSFDKLFNLISITDNFNFNFFKKNQNDYKKNYLYFFKNKVETYFEITDEINFELEKIIRKLREDQLLIFNEKKHEHKSQLKKLFN